MFVSCIKSPNCILSILYIGYILETTQIRLNDLGIDILPKYSKKAIFTSSLKEPM